MDMSPVVTRFPLAPSLRWSLALWMGLVALSPALSVAETPEPTDEAPLAAPEDVAPDAQAVTDPGAIKHGTLIPDGDWMRFWREHQ